MRRVLLGNTGMEIGRVVFGGIVVSGAEQRDADRQVAAAVEAGAGLRGEDRLPLLSLGELLGASDAEGQREALLVQEALLQTQLDQARARRDTRGRASLMLGILAGLTLMILLM